MKDIPEADLAETRAALAPTLEATAAVLPFLSQAKALRFDEKLNERWIAAGKQLSAAWLERHHHTEDRVRPALFALYGIALETSDPDCLLLGEALAEAADRLETAETPILIAALSAAIETLPEPEGLEHPNFVERARHFAARLSTAVCIQPETKARSPLIDHLFVEEAEERLEHMRCALAVLPADALALRTEITGLLQQADQLELWGIVHAARALARLIEDSLHALDDVSRRDQIAEDIDQLAQLISAIET